MAASDWLLWLLQVGTCLHNLGVNTTCPCSRSLLPKREWLPAVGEQGWLVLNISALLKFSSKNAVQCPLNCYLEGSEKKLRNITN
jgi:hypothetical protein